MDSFYEGRFGVALECIDRVSGLASPFNQAGVDRFERVLPVVLSLAIAEEVEVGPVHHQDLGHGRRVCRRSPANVQFWPKLTHASGKALRGPRPAGHTLSLRGRTRNQFVADRRL